MSVFPQLSEVNIYSSIYASVQRAEITLYDAIGLLTNFPLVGEETVILDFTTAGSNITQTIEMVATKPMNLIPGEMGRSATFTLMCYSKEILLNNVVRIQQCYSQLMSDTVTQILTDKLKTTKKIVTEPSKGIQNFIVPNMYPLEAIRLITQMSVAETQNHYNYTFFENADGFHFETLEKLASAKPKAEYKYYSQTVPFNQQDEFYRILNLTQSKRYDTIEKQTMGFYSNELYQIDYFNKKVVSSKTYIDENKPDPLTIAPGQLNTPAFITKMKSTPRSIGNGAASRVRYRTLNGARDVQPTFMPDKFGLGVVHKTAFSQIAATITVPGDSKITAGDVVSLRIPEFHGFDEIQYDPYIQGSYLVVDICHKIRSGEKHIMTMNLSRDSYNQPIGKTRYPT